MNKHPLFSFFACLTLLLVACQSQPQPAVAKSTKQALFQEKPILVENGKASYYYGRWIGRLTASGEIYRCDDVTAAHKKLPFGTIVRATNLQNGRSVVVRINNRGPYSRGRILDLSLRAAEELDMKTSGVVPIRLEVLKPTAPDNIVRNYIQYGQFQDRGSRSSSRG